MNLAGTEVRTVERCGSTNTALLEEGKPGVLLVADEQTAGRGRRGRRWYSAPGADIAFSLSAEVANPVAGLSLVAGVAAARALRALGVAQAALKWPNDLLAGGRVLTGLARGLDRDGGLRLETRIGLLAVHSGRILSARAA